MLFRNSCRAVLFCILAASQAVAQDSLPPSTHSPDDSLPTAHTVSPALTQAEDSIAHQDYDKAITLLNISLQQKPNDARALYDLGFAYDADNRSTDAESAWRHAIASDPTQFESRLAFGFLLARQGNADAAREQLQIAITLSPAAGTDAAKAPAYRALARLNASYDPVAASDDLQMAIKLSQETTDDTLLAAELAENVGDNDDAEATYRRLLVRDPHAPEATAALAHLLVRQEKYSDAETLLTGALTDHPNDPPLTAQLAGVYAAEDRADDAIPLLETLYAATPTDLNVERMLAALYTQTGNAAKADPLYINLLSHGTPDAALLTDRGNNLIRQGRHADAETILRQSVAADPTDGNAWSALAFAASQNHNPQTCLNALTQRAKYLPDTPSSLFLYAISYDALHQYKTAMGFYNRFLAVTNGKFPDEEWEAKHRLIALANMTK